jgi:hypothetical protein
VPVNHAALKSEIINDPRGYSYATWWDVGDDVGVARALNLIRDGSPGTIPANPTAGGGVATGVISVNKGTISTQELVEAVVQSEMPANANQRDWLIMVSSGDRVRVDPGSTARAGLLAIFPAGTTTRANLTAAAMRPASRAEELFGIGTTVTSQDVAKARTA